jgi:hypothetical protein
MLGRLEATLTRAWVWRFVLSFHVDTVVNLCRVLKA